MYVISITNQKGGVGKTTTAVNVADEVASLGKRVLLIDLDPQGNASSGLGFRRSEKGVYDLLCNTNSDDANNLSSVKNSDLILTTRNPNLFVICGNQNLAGAEIELVNATNRESKLKNAISNFEDEFDLVIIDCPPSLSILTINALVASDYILIPVQPEFYALEGVSLLIETIAKVKQLWNNKLEIIGVIMTMHDKRNILHRQVEDDLRKHFKSILFNVIITRNIRLAEAASFGKSIKDYDKNSSGSLAYTILAKELVRRIWKTNA